MPSDIIIREGVFGDEMYIVGDGRVVVSTSEGVMVAMLGRGAYFGEMALLTEGQRRANRVEADSICDVYCLQKADLDHIFTLYPKLRLDMLEEVAKRKQQNAIMYENNMRAPPQQQAAPEAAPVEARRLSKSDDGSSKRFLSGKWKPATVHPTSTPPPAERAPTVMMGGAAADRAAEMAAASREEAASAAAAAAASREELRLRESEAEAEGVGDSATDVLSRVMREHSKGCVLGSSSVAMGR